MSKQNSRFPATLHRSANIYAGNGLDRATHRRSDPLWLAEALASAQAGLALFRRGEILVTGPDDAPRILFTCPPASLPETPLFLGLHSGRPVFALEISEDSENGNLPDGRGRFAEVRQIGPLLPPDEANLLVMARGLLIWQARTRFCATCGHALATEEAGHVRRCLNPACAIPHFPRSDPVVIMLVTNGNRALLGRQAAWTPGIYSVLAGFVEPGESLEQAVAREVLEESGIIVDHIHYHSSQPWPFPSSLMLGFRATAIGGVLAANPDELEDAAWFERDFLRQALHRTLPASETFLLPRRDSLSRRLLEEWLEEESGP
jgi:NAD+ diphosphatase